MNVEPIKAKIKSSNIPAENPTIVDDPVKRCFRFLSEGKEYFSLSFLEVKALPMTLQKYFHIQSPEREDTAYKEASKYLNLHGSWCTKNEIAANYIITSLLHWAYL